MSRPHPIDPDDAFGLAASRAGVPQKYLEHVLRLLVRHLPEAERLGPDHPEVLGYLATAARLLSRPDPSPTTDT